MCTENLIGVELLRNRRTLTAMVALILLAIRLLVALFKSKNRLETENGALR